MIFFLSNMVSTDNTFKRFSDQIDETDSEEPIEFPQNCCMAFMPDFRYGEYIYWNEMDGKPNSYHNT